MKKFFSNTLQVCVVVKDLEKSMATYYDKYGIGPWAGYRFDKNNVDQMMYRGKRIDYAMDIGMCKVGNVEFELIQPLDDNNLYAEFLKEHGEGLQHICLAVDDHDDVAKNIVAMGCPIIQQGDWKGDKEGEYLTYTYLDTVDQLGFILELYKVTPGFAAAPFHFDYPKGSATKFVKDTK